MELWWPKKIILVRINNTINGFNFTCFKLRKNRVEEIKQQFNSVSSILENNGSDTAYWLQFEGVGTLSRVVDIQVSHAKDVLLNVDEVDFYFSICNGENNKLVSFVRRKLIDDIVAAFNVKRSYLLGVSCGWASYSVALEKSDVLLFDYELSKDQYGDFALKKNEAIFDDGSVQNVKGQSLALNLSAFLFNKRNDSFFPYLFVESVNEVKEFQKFQKIGVVSLSFLFFLVLFNFFYTKYYNTIIVEKEAEVALNITNLSILDKVNEEHARKSFLAENSDNSTNFFLAMYLDQLASNIPAEIRLIELYVFPLVDHLKDKRKVEVNKELIEIVGYVDESEFLDEWIATLNRYSWVKAIELINYQKEVHEAKFKINITIHR